MKQAELTNRALEPRMRALALSITVVSVFLMGTVMKRFSITNGWVVGTSGVDVVTCFAVTGTVAFICFLCARLILTLEPRLLHRPVINAAYFASVFTSLAFWLFFDIVNAGVAAVATMCGAVTAIFVFANDGLLKLVCRISGVEPELDGHMNWNVTGRFSPSALIGFFVAGISWKFRDEWGMKDIEVLSSLTGNDWFKENGLDVGTTLFANGFGAVLFFFTLTTITNWDYYRKPMPLLSVVVASFAIGALYSVSYGAGHAIFGFFGCLIGGALSTVVAMNLNLRRMMGTEAASSPYIAT